ncbi:MAG: hypothetical protein QOJ19_36, partial [Acidimicrobiia bacterium]|nr:hypothetical protein [Acidimicrobiia bacterium]
MPRRSRLVVVEDLGVRHPGAVVERGVQVAVADAPAGCPAAAVELPAAAVGDGRQFLDVNVDELARTFPLIAPHRRLGACGPITPVETGQSGPAQNGLHGRGGQADLLRDALRPAAALEAPFHHPLRNWLQGRRWRAPRPAGAVPETGLAFPQEAVRHLRTVLASTWKRS